MYDEHHPFGGSSLDRRFACNASYWMELGMPGTSSNDSDRGTLQHEAIYKDEVYDELTENEQDSVDIVRNVIGPRENIIFEEKLYLYGNIAGKRVPISFGSCDIQIRRDDNSCRIADAKFGAGPVPIDTWQTKSYAVSSIQKHDWDYVDHGIIQPMRRIGPWHIMTRGEADEIASEIQAKIIDCKKAAKYPSYRIYATGIHCKYCKANWFCPALRDVEGSIESEKIEQAIFGNSSEMWDTAEAIKGKAKSISQRIQAISMATQSAPDGFFVKDINGRRKIADPNATAQKLISLGVPLDDIFKATTMKIGKIQELATKAIREKMGCTKAEADEIFERDFPVEKSKPRQELVREL